MNAWPLRPERLGKEALYRYQHLVELVAARILLNDGWPLAKVSDYVASAKLEQLVAQFRRKTHGTGRSGRQTWIRQFREYQDRIKTGTVFDIAEVLRNLLLLQKEKELSFGEHRVLDSARTMLAEELAAVERRSVEEILAEIKQLARA